MSERLYKYLEITDIKDMLNKTDKLYGEKIAYKIKNKDKSYKTFTHSEVRKMINAIRYSINKHGIKR